MAIHPEAVIIDALFDHLKTVALPAGAKIAWPGMDFIPEPTKPYLQVRLLKNDPIQPRIRFGAQPIRRGILQVSVFWPSGQGIVKASELAGKVCDLFVRGTSLTKGSVKVRIMEEPRVASDIQETAWLQVPVSINWIVYP